MVVAWGGGRGQTSLTSGSRTKRSVYLSRQTERDSDTILDHQVEDAATQFGAGLVQLGIETGQDSFVGIYARNSPEVSCVYLWSSLV